MDAAGKRRGSTLPTRRLRHGLQQFDGLLIASDRRVAHGGHGIADAFECRQIPAAMQCTREMADRRGWEILTSPSNPSYPSCTSTSKRHTFLAVGDRCSL